MTRINIATLLGSICDTTNCQESGCINWQSLISNSIHIRIDGKAITDQTIPKCDCLILYSPTNLDYTWVTIIEVKGTNPTINEVTKQLQTCLDKYNEVISELRRHLPTKAEFTKMLLPNFRNNAQLILLISKTIDHIFKGKTRIVPVLYAVKNVSRMKRTGYSRPFRLSNKQRIVFMECKKDLRTLFNTAA